MPFFFGYYPFLLRILRTYPTQQLAAAIACIVIATCGRFIFRTTKHAFCELVHSRHGPLLDYAPYGNGFIDIIITDSKISSLVNVNGYAWLTMSDEGRTNGDEFFCVLVHLCLIQVDP